MRKRVFTELMPKLVENQPFIFFAGTIRIVIGLAVLVGNGPWGSTAIQTVVALIGWISLVREHRHAAGHDRAAEAAH